MRQARPFESSYWRGCQDAARFKLLNRHLPLFHCCFRVSNAAALLQLGRYEGCHAAWAGVMHAPLLQRRVGRQVKGVEAVVAGQAAVQVRRRRVACVHVFG